MGLYLSVGKYVGHVACTIMGISVSHVRGFCVGNFCVHFHVYVWARSCIWVRM